MRKNDYITEAELRMLMNGECGEDKPTELFDLDERKLLHALVRNQLRQLHMIEELQSEIRMMRSAMEARGRAAHSESTAALDPLPFMRASKSAPDGVGERQIDEQQEAPPAAPSRKERFKRRTLWGRK